MIRGNDEPSILVIGEKDLIELFSADFQYNDFSLFMDNLVSDWMQLFLSRCGIDGEEFERFVVFGTSKTEADSLLCFLRGGNELGNAPRQGAEEGRKIFARIDRAKGGSRVCILDLNPGGEKREVGTVKVEGDYFSRKFGIVCRPSGFKNVKNSVLYEFP